MKFNLPKSFEREYINFHLPKKLHNTLILSDIHMPYHHIPALEEALNYGIIKKIDSILLNGDIIDCYKLSKFEPDPRERDFWQEIEAFKVFIKELNDIFHVPIYYKIGNHEERYERTMTSKCAEFLKLPYFEFENVMGCKELGVTVIKDQRTIYIGGLAVFHGHELKMHSANVNPARTLYLRTHVSSLCSHLHRTSQHTEPAFDRDITCWSTGHLGDAHPKYAPINKWNWGCARVESNSDGNFEVINVNLTNNKLFMI